jgi:hypothetical protein
MRLRLLTIATALALPCTYTLADNVEHSVAPVATQQPQVADTDRTQSPGALEPDGRVRSRDVRRYSEERASAPSGDRYVYRDRYRDYSSGSPRMIAPVVNAPQVPDTDAMMSPGAVEPDGSRISARRFGRS